MDWSSDAYRKMADIATPRGQRPLGELAVRAGYLTFEELESALRDQEKFPEKDRPRIGELLIRRGHLRPGQLSRLLEQQADEAGLHDPGWRYEIIEAVARGATATVYRARDRELRREVAVKVIRREHMLNAELNRRMLQEARIGAALNHPGIMPVHDMGTREGLVFIVMPLFEGKTLAERLLQEDVPLKENVSLLERVAEALHHAHRQGVVHRDIKPGNILINPDGNPMIADFGLARLAGAESFQTRTGAVVGTPAYMAPEQVRGEQASIGSGTDVYALGALLYQVLTGAPPFAGESPAEIYNAILSREPARPSRLNPRAPADLETIALKALNKDPGDRFEDAGEMGADLKRWREGRPIQARRTGIWGKLSRICRRYPWQSLLVAASLIVTTGTIVGTNMIIGELEDRIPASREVSSPGNEEILRFSTLALRIHVVRTEYRSGRMTWKEFRRETDFLIHQIGTPPLQSPLYPMSRYLKARIFWEQGNPVMALHHLKEAESVRPDFRPALLLSILIGMESRLPPWIAPEGVDARAVWDFPQLESLTNRLEKSRTGIPSVCRTPFEDSLEALLPAWHRVIRDADRIEAYEALTPLMIEEGSDEVLLLASRIRGNPADQERIRAILLARSPGHPVALLDEGIAGKSAPAAIATLSSRIRKRPWDPGPFYLRAAFFQSEGEIQKAADDLSRAETLLSPPQPAVLRGDTN